MNIPSEDANAPDVRLESLSREERRFPNRLTVTEKERPTYWRIYYRDRSLWNSAPVDTIVNSDFGLRISFGFRISDFGLRASDLQKDETIPAPPFRQFEI